MDSQVTQHPPKNTPSRRLVALIGCCLLFGPVIGLAGTVVGMLRAFSTLKDSGTPDPSELARSDIPFQFQTWAVNRLLLYTSMLTNTWKLKANSQ